ncbi:MAG: alpha/beta hydrolase [Alphaproteobacteria bacterium]|nr:alpha/beta hydrolase [Alphaproteobacteria bacterium]
MPDVIFTGPSGRLEGKYQHQKHKTAPIALILHPHPQHGGTMNNRVTYEMFYAFQRRGCSVLRFNFRGVGRSQGVFDGGIGELSDAAAALDWLQTMNPGAQTCWVVGFSFGSWISMQLLMRRPEIHAFITIAPPANIYDFTFLAPCPASGLIVHGRNDQVSPEADVQKMVDRLNAQRGIKITQVKIEGANHFFDQNLPELVKTVEDYLDMRMPPVEESG